MPVTFLCKLEGQRSFLFKFRSSLNHSSRPREMHKKSRQWRYVLKSPMVKTVSSQAANTIPLTNIILDPDVLIVPRDVAPALAGA